MFCWCTILPSIVTSTSNPASTAFASNSPFAMPAHPINGTDSIRCPGKSRPDRQSKFSSSRIRASARCENMRSGFLEQRDDLFALHARKAFKKLLDRVSCFQMIEEAFRRDPRAGKYWLAPEHLGILRNDATHNSILRSKRSES